MEINQIIKGWITKFNYDAFSAEEKKKIDTRIKTCAGNTEEGIPKCENFVAAPVYAVVTEVIESVLKVKAWFAKEKKVIEIDDPYGRKTKTKNHRTTDEIVGGSYRCTGCGCDFGASVAIKKKEDCPLKKWTI